MIGTDCDYSWYLAASKTREEFRAVEHLFNQGIKAFAPSINIEKIQAGRKIVVSEAMFKGYIFVNLFPEHELWHKVRSTRGVRDWVRFANKVAKVPCSLVDSLIQQNAENKFKVIKKCFNLGDKVEVMSGPFKGLSGLYQTSCGETRSLILIDFLGKQSRLELENKQIKVDC
jgi:transcriptional antiterminator RfaH